jgi:hypothetical protein
MPTRRTVLAAGVTVAAVAAAGGVTLVTRRPALPLTLEALRPLVGSRFTVEGTPVTLTALTGLRGGAPRDDAFRLQLTASRTDGLPSGIRTFAHADGDLVLHTEPVGPDGTTLEALVRRTA